MELTIADLKVGDTVVFVDDKYKPWPQDLEWARQVLKQGETYRISEILPPIKDRAYPYIKLDGIRDHLFEPNLFDLSGIVKVKRETLNDLIIMCNTMAGLLEGFRMRSTEGVSKKVNEHIEKIKAEM